jgi:hypothetical protein
VAVLQALEVLCVDVSEWASNVREEVLRTLSTHIKGKARPHHPTLIGFDGAPPFACQERGEHETHNASSIDASYVPV